MKDIEFMKIMRELTAASHTLNIDVKLEGLLLASGICAEKNRFIFKIIINDYENSEVAQFHYKFIFNETTPDGPDGEYKLADFINADMPFYMNNISDVLRQIKLNIASNVNDAKIRMSAANKRINNALIITKQRNRQARNAEKDHQRALAIAISKH